ncbi:transcriptional regulator, LacI family [Amycolatopsis marina]|uniref:Transcriptional regulator, LacI family n=1 Tax=Amycolatopsis marina TaxID=490629 RepID=A0A1I1BZV5_9PSEU|nr:LacI family DNA-binding transcriptional regulator [Amycolatopsis marina]SFB55954.1 transcriptional regulator, LacI family [Amycolatopsis marina]
MPITSNDVARLAGVSQPTVSRALRGDPRVSPATRDRVREAAAALGYVPSEAGRSLVTRSSKRVGIVVTDLTNPFYPHLIGPLHDELEKHGYRMLVFTERSDSQMASAQLLDGSIDGAVLLTSTIGSALPADLDRRGLPFVFLNREGGGAGGDAAAVDNALGGRIAAQHLVELGHRRIAGLFGPEDTTTGRDRELGFRLALADAGIGLPAALTRNGTFDFDTGYHGLTELMTVHPRPTALFCGNDVMAMGALNAALRQGIDVPGELSVVGFDNIPMSAWESFQLTTIGHDLGEMAASAARLLVERITEGSPRPPGQASRRIVLEPHLITRATTSAPPA